MRLRLACTRRVDEEHYGIDILTRVLSLTSAPSNIGPGLLHDHMGYCIADAAQLSGQASDAIAPLVCS